ncbi:uncharacterized protein LOC101753518 [Setaria italica]|uniref:uncharacterized protein LOC101753518 n=1 Tax=Setaria italica TaxID=4555 RepID=UPI000BE5A991|nr:uncharacterized protein LOC101753518 [Setaria italica]
MTSARFDQSSMEELDHTKDLSEKLVAGVAESASALTLQEPDASSSGGWYQVYFIRTDRSGYFRMYPDLGGPFQSLDQVDCAINHHLAKLQHPSEFEEKDNYSIVDKLIHEHNYYPDGTPKRTNSRSKTNPNEEQRHLVQAILDQYNDDNNLFGVHAHELESLVRHKGIYENDRWFYHFNFTTKTKGANGTLGSSNLFFAEVSHMREEDAWEVNCCCTINSDDNGHCYGCRNNGSPGMQHPTDTGAYTGGHLDEYLPFGGGSPGGDLDDPSVLERIYSYFDRDRNTGET